MDATTGLGLTVSFALALLPAYVAVIVWVPQRVAEHDPVVQVPSGVMLNALAAVWSPRLLPYPSNPSVVYACELPAVMVAWAGVRAMWSKPAGLTASVAGP